MRRLLLLTATAAAVLGAPAAAQAARITITGTAGPAAEVYPLYRADPGERNRVRVAISRKAVVITDRGAHGIRLAKNADECSVRGRHRVLCAGDFFVDLRLGDRDDSVSFANAPAGRAPASTNPVKYSDIDRSNDEGAPSARTFISGGAGNDVIRGSRYDDFIYPGAGRDRVDGRASGDTVFLADDGRHDTLAGAGGVDTLSFSGRKPVTVDLAAGHGGGDALSGFERVHGTDHADTLRGTNRSEGLYGDGGRDTVDGRGGNDLVAGDSDYSHPAANTIIAGDGDDVLEAEGVPPGGATTVDCGAGADRVLSENDDLLDPSCEFDVFRVQSQFNTADVQGWLFELRVPVQPVARDAGSVTFEIPCPTSAQASNAACAGTVVVERPRQLAPPAAASYGSAQFDIATGARANVTVPLNAAGQAALLAGEPLAVHVAGDLKLPPGSVQEKPDTFDFGWQVVVAR